MKPQSANDASILPGSREAIDRRRGFAADSGVSFFFFAMLPTAANGLRLGLGHRDAEAARDSVQALVAGPQVRPCRQVNGGKQMNIDVADAEANQLMLVDEIQNFVVGRRPGLRKVRQGLEDDVARLQMAQGEFANYERMGQHLSSIQQSAKFAVTGAQMPDPNRRVDKDHEREGRRRGGAFRRG